MGRRQTLAAKMDTVPIGTEATKESEGRVRRAMGTQERRDKKGRQALRAGGGEGNKQPRRQTRTKCGEKGKPRSGKEVKRKKESPGQKGGRNLKIRGLLAKYGSYLSTDSHMDATPRAHAIRGTTAPPSTPTIPPSTVCLTRPWLPGGILTAHFDSMRVMDLGSWYQGMFLTVT